MKKLLTLLLLPLLCAACSPPAEPQPPEPVLPAQEEPNLKEELPAVEQPAKREPYIEYTPGQNVNSLYLANIDIIPEFTDRNEGSAAWIPAEQTLDLRITVGMGSVTGALDGPRLHLAVQWTDGTPQIIKKEFEPAPVFSHPQEVQNSGAELLIEDERLIEIATLLRAMIEEYGEGEQP